MKRILAILFTMLTLGVPMHASEFVFRNISWAGYHSGSTVRAFYRDATGYCWMGIDNQLVRFDGSHFVDFPLPLPEDRRVYITSIGGVEGKFMFAGSNVGLWRVPDGDDGHGIGRVFEHEIASVGCISVIDSATMAIGTPGGIKIYKYPEQGLKSIFFASDRSAAENAVLASVKDANKLYAVTKGGLARIDLATMKPVIMRRDRGLADATSMAAAAGRLFVGTSTAGLRVFNATTGEPAGTIDVGCNVVTSLSLSDAGTLFVGTDGNGVLEIRPTDLSIVNHLTKTSRPVSLTSNQVYSVMSCCGNELWVGYYQGAADYSLHQRNYFKTYDLPGLIDTRGVTIRTLNLSKDGLMLGTRSGLYFLPEGKNNVVHITSPRLRSDMVLAIHKSGDIYYIGTYGGGSRIYNPATDTLTEISTDDSYPFKKGHVFAIEEDAKGNIWFGTSAGLISYKNGKVVRHINVGNSRLPDNNVYSIFFDTAGRGWIGTDRGLVAIDPETGAILTDFIPKGFPSTRSIRHIYEDSAHKLYFISEKGQLTVGTLDLSEYQDADSRLFHGAEVRSIVEDRDKMLWVTTNNGLYRWDKGATARRFGFADGIQNTAFINGNMVMDGNGEIWAGNPDGLLRFNPSEISEPADNSPIVVTGISVDERYVDDLFLAPDVKGRYEIKLGERPDAVKIMFSDFLYSKPDLSNYEYSLDGETWPRHPRRWLWASTVSTGARTRSICAMCRTRRT